MTLSETINATLDQNVFPIATQDGRDDRESVESALSRTLGNPYGSSGGRRAINLHDSIASILVSNKKSEVIAVGSAVIDNCLKIFVASNGTPLNHTKEYLEEVWGSLKKIQRTIDGQRKSPSSFGDLNTFEYHKELRYLVYERSIAKFMKRFSKGRLLGLPDFFDEVLRVGSGYVVSEPPQHLKYIRRDEVELLTALRYIYAAALNYELSPDKETLAELADLIAMIRVTLKEKQVFSDIRPTSLFSRCDHILEGIRTLKPNAFRRFWEKIFSLEHSLHELLRLSYSRNMGEFLQIDCTIDIVQQGTVQLQYNLIEDNEFRDIFTETAWTHDKFLELYGDALPEQLEYDEDVAPHCECALLAYFLNNNITAYGYIGMSKLSCLGCSLYFQAYNKVAEERELSPFFTRGTRSKECHPWAKPQIRDRDLGEQFENALVPLAKKFFLKALQAVRERTLSDSTDTSGASGDAFETTYWLKGYGGLPGSC